MEISEFKNAVAKCDGLRLETLRQRRPFLLNVERNGMRFIPGSSGRDRFESWSRIEQVLGVFNETRSLTPTDYHELTHNSSYFVTVLHHLTLGK